MNEGTSGRLRQTESQENGEGRIDHNAYLDKGRGYEQMTRYVSQLKSIYNPTQVQNEINRHDKRSESTRLNSSHGGISRMPSSA